MEQAPISLQEAVSALHVAEPRLEVREVVNGDGAEKVLGVDEDEVIRVHEKRLPDCVSVVPELSEVRRGDGPQRPILRDNDVHEADLVDARVADFSELGREKLLTQELVERLVEKVLDARRDLQVDRRERAVEELTVRLDTIRAVGSEALVDRWV